MQPGEFGLEVRLPRTFTFNHLQSPNACDARLNHPRACAGVDFALLRPNHRRARPSVHLRCHSVCNAARRSRPIGPAAQVSSGKRCVPGSIQRVCALFNSDGFDFQFPVPLSEIVCGEPDALSVNATVALNDPVAVGAKTRNSEQLAPAARAVPQLSVWRKELAFAPLI